jgi:hypothetical protein
MTRLKVKPKPGTCTREADSPIKDCARCILEYILSNRRRFIRNVLAGDGELKVTTTVLKSLAHELCGLDLTRGGGLGRLISALTAIARRRGFAVEYIIARHPTKIEKKTLYLKPKHRERAKARN